MLHQIRRFKRLLSSLEKLDELERATLNGMSPVDKHCFLNSRGRFSGHYEMWRTKRINKILELHGAEWSGKRVVELAGGFGDMSAFFADLGAQVTYVDGRLENLNMAKLRYRHLDNLKFELRNLEEDYSDLGRFDLAIHFGLLYHIKNVDTNLASCAALSDEIVLETEVLDTLDESKIEFIDEDRSKHDSALAGVGCKISPFYVKRFFEERGFDVDIVMDPKLNASKHVYDWTHQDDGTWKEGMRRFFRISKRASA